MICDECENKIIDSVGNTWCRAKECVVSEALIEKSGCKLFIKK